VQPKRDRFAAMRFFRKLLRGNRTRRASIITDKLRSYGAAKRVVMPGVAHRQHRYLNNRAENSHQPTRERERRMRRFKSARHAQRFVEVHGIIASHFRPRRHLLSAADYRRLRSKRFRIWNQVTGTSALALARRLQSARLKERGVIEDIDYQHPRGLDRKLLRTLAASEWVRQNQNVLFIGPTGIGKSWLACALAHKACRDGFSVLHKRTTELFRELAVAHVDGSIGRVLLKLSRVDVLVLDDFAMAPLKDSERRDFLEICDDR
jgi:DNA replication protein DnaC